MGSQEEWDDASWSVLCESYGMDAAVGFDATAFGDMYSMVQVGAMDAPPAGPSPIVPSLPPRCGGLYGGSSQLSAFSCARACLWLW